MPVKLGTPCCPTCCAYARFVSTVVACNTRLVRTEGGEFEYDGGSDICWDGLQTPFDAKNRAEVQCSGGHLWHTTLEEE